MFLCAVMMFESVGVPLCCDDVLVLNAKKLCEKDERRMVEHFELIITLVIIMHMIISMCEGREEHFELMIVCP